MSAAVSSRTTRFPESVWDVPVLRALDARSRSELEAAGRLREVREDETVFRAGDPADALYVVIEGACIVSAVRRGDTETTVLRRVRAGDVFGEEAIVTGSMGSGLVRAFEARAATKTRLAEIPIPVLLRAVGRAGDGEVVGRLERALRRAASLDLVRATAFGRKLGDRDLENVVDSIRHLHLARGEHLYRAGDPSIEAFFVADGLLSAQTEDDGKPRVEAYLSRGDLVGEDELDAREPRRLSVVASGPAWLVALPRDVYLSTARKNGALLEGTRRLRALPVLQAPRGVHTTAHVFADVYRLRVARSLLVIDQDSCIRCGHCAWSCADVHDDGIARLVRRGDKVVVQADEGVAPLLVPNSCQHCKNPACMIDCPTGAIGRDARGEVFIREDLCTGCGACAKGCPWDNIQIAKRSDAKSKFPEVAVKCDLCAGSAAGPACVASCPTQAIARIDPSTDLAELRAIAPATRLGREPSPSIVPPKIRAWPAIAGAACAAVGIAVVPLGKWTSGYAAAFAFLFLVAYSGAKRTPRILARTKVPGIARLLYIAHASLGTVLAGVTLAHSGLRVPQNAAGALLLALGAVIVTGALGALLNVLVPPKLARLERTSVLPEELASRARDLDERIFEKLSGRTELVKTLFGKVLRPYRRARFGALLLATSGRSLRKEEKRLRAKIDALLEGKKSDRLSGLDDLVRLVVERRAVGAQAILTRALRGWLAIHLAATAAAVVLLVLHFVAVWGRP